MSNTIANAGGDRDRWSLVRQHLNGPTGTSSSASSSQGDYYVPPQRQRYQDRREHDRQGETRDYDNPEWRRSGHRPQTNSYDTNRYRVLSGEGSEGPEMTSASGRHARHALPSARSAPLAPLVPVVIREVKGVWAANNAVNCVTAPAPIAAVPVMITLVPALPGSRVYDQRLVDLQTPIKNPPPLPPIYVLEPCVRFQGRLLLPG